MGVNIKNGTFGNPSIVANGLVFYTDAANQMSYVSGSTTWNDLSGNNTNGSLPSGFTFNNNFGGNFSFSGSNQFVSITETNLTDWSISCWFKYNYSPQGISTNILALPLSSGNKSGQIGWARTVFQGISSISSDTTGSIYFGTFGMGIWNDTPRWFGLKLTPTGSLDNTFDINYTVGSAVSQTGFYVGNDEFLYSSGTNLNFFAKRNKQTGTLISQANANATSIDACFVIDETNRKVYHMGAYTTAFGLSRNYLCKFDLDTYAVDTVFNTGGGLNSSPTTQQIFLTSDKQYLYAVGAFTSYKGTPINHIVKLDQSGSLDPTFNPGTGFSSTANLRCGLDSQDRLVCVGRVFTSYSGSACNGIVRINTDGTRDTTFNIGTGFNTVGLSAKDLSIQSDDKVLVVGAFTSYSGSACNGIVRINPDGTRDTTFDIGTGISPIDSSIASHIKSNGEIVLMYGVIGSLYSYNGVSFKTAILLDSSGSVVSGFETGSGFTDTTSRSETGIRIRNTAGTLTTVSNFNAYPFGNRAAPITFQTAFNNWVNLTYTKGSANTLLTYINGNLVQTQAIGTASFQNLDLQIDRLAGSTDNNISNIIIYNRTLSQQEVTQNYNAQKSRFGLL
jgi:hypothetical protein